VRVAAELKFKDIKELKRSYDPDRRVVVAERVETTKSSGSGTRVGGPAGSASNVPGEEQQTATSSQTPASESQTENIDTEYLVSESQTETVERGAEIKRLTVAAFIDTSALSEGDGEGQAGGPAIADITRIVKDAIGLDESRGDTLKVVEADFQPVSEELAAVQEGMPAWLMPVGKYFAIGMLALVLLFIARRVMKGLAAASPRQVVVPEVMGAESGGPPARIDEDELIRREIAKFVRESPEVAGRMLEGWVEGEE
jgi:flagellar M-ring protein FliF